MKKITFLFVALLTSCFLMAQTAIIDRPVNGVFSVIATQGTDGGIYMADQFELTTDTTLGAIQIFGFIESTGSLGNLLTGLNVFIYEDVSGLPAGDPSLPGTGLVELADVDLANVIVNDGPGFADFTTNITAANGGTDITLPAGTYWLVSFPTVSTNVAGAGRWNWFASGATPDIEPVLIDPEDLFGGGITSWTNASGLVSVAIPGMAWTLFDEAILSVSDSVIQGLSLSPNPTNGMVNINLPANRVLDTVSVYDIAGREVLTTNVNVNSIDLGNMSNGIYIARLTTTDGLTQSVRIVKQ